MRVWLNTTDQTWSPTLGKLLKPFEESDGLLCYPVPKEVGKVGNQSPDFLKVSFPLLCTYVADNFDPARQLIVFLQPVSQRKGNIASFFNKQREGSSQVSIDNSIADANKTSAESIVEDSSRQSQLEKVSDSKLDSHNQDLSSSSAPCESSSFPDVSGPTTLK